MEEFRAKVKVVKGRARRGRYWGCERGGFVDDDIDWNSVLKLLSCPFVRKNIFQS